MTTHEQQTVTDSHDETPIPVSEAIPASEAPATHDESTGVAPESEPVTDTSVQRAEDPGAEPSKAEHESSAAGVLFAGDDLAELRARWAGVQAAFVDDPKECVEQADGLVSDLVEQLTAGFAETRTHLEEQWHRGEEASTEDLRLALMHYRQFFERLLAV
jgi:hypothetical protein